jgi:hypothetical protein
LSIAAGALVAAHYHQSYTAEFSLSLPLEGSARDEFAPARYDYLPSIRGEELRAALTGAQVLGEVAPMLPNDPQRATLRRRITVRAPLPADVPTSHPTETAYLSVAIRATRASTALVESRAVSDAINRLNDRARAVHPEVPAIGITVPSHADAPPSAAVPWIEAMLAVLVGAALSAAIFVDSSHYAIVRDPYVSTRPSVDSAS